MLFSWAQRLAPQHCSDRKNRGARPASITMVTSVGPRETFHKHRPGQATLCSRSFKTKLSTLGLKPWTPGLTSCPAHRQTSSRAALPDASHPSPPGHPVLSEGDGSTCSPSSIMSLPIRCPTLDYEVLDETNWMLLYTPMLALPKMNFSTSF